MLNATMYPISLFITIPPALAISAPPAVSMAACREEHRCQRPDLSKSKPFQPNPSCFQCFRSVGKFVPEFRKHRVSSSKLRTTWNYLEQIRSNLTKGDSGMCTAVAHHPFFTYLLPYYLSNLVPACFWPIYIHSPHSLFPQLSCLLLAVGWAWALLPSI